jgi:hypothetical protein
MKCARPCYKLVGPYSLLKAHKFPLFVPHQVSGISTILCMLPLIFVPTYAIVAFAKTVFIVVGVGLLHGLFLLPTLLCFLPRTLSFSPVNEENPPTPTREILLPPVAETEATIPE